MNNKLLKVLCSLPVIIFFLYFIPVLGIVLILIRGFAYPRKKMTNAGIIIAVFGAIMYIPYIVDKYIDNKYLSMITEHDVYISLHGKLKFVIGVGIVFTILSIIMKNMLNKMFGNIKMYMLKEEQVNREAKEKAALEMEIRKEEIKNNHTVLCPHCGGINVLNTKIGKCKFCRRTIE